MLNLIHQIVFNENKVKKSSSSYNPQKTIDFIQEISCLNNNFKFLHYSFFENLTMQLQSYENSPSQIQCKECL